MSFEKLGLKAELLRAVVAQGYTTPTPIQLKAIPAVLTGRDVLAGAQTGTGKTAAFALPILQMLDRPGVKTRHPRALVLTPTRELAAQVEESIRTYGAHSPLRSTVIFGGVGFNPQADRLRQGVDILVATPGRLLDHTGQKTLDLSCVEILVLDEADRMLDMGFIHDIRKIIKLLPAKRQNMMFSATYSNDIKQLANTILNQPELIEVARRNIPAELVSHFVYNVSQDSKLPLLARLIKDNEVHQALVFTRTKHGANRLAQQLCKNDIDAAAIHGNKSQAARTRALADFKSAKIQILVATDIAARGLDIDSLPHVVNYELPNVPEDYIHRIGRTGRAGSPGTALSLVCPGERQYLDDIQRLLGHKITMKDTGRIPEKDEFKTVPDTRPERFVRGESRYTRPGAPPQSRPQSSRPQSGRPQGQGGRPQSSRPQDGGRRQERPAGGDSRPSGPRQFGSAPRPARPRQGDFARQGAVPRLPSRPQERPATQAAPRPQSQAEPKTGGFSLKKLGFWRRGGADDAQA